MMNRIFFAFILFAKFCFSQNMVPNPGFENAWTCPESFTKERIKKILPEWFVPNFSTPDYFNKCNTSDVGIPENFTGSMNAKEGNAYIGMILKESFNPDNEKYDPAKDEYSREYISAKLLTPLKHLKMYCVSFNFCLAKYSDYATDALGVYFSKEKLKIKSDGIITAKQQIFKKGKLLKSKNKWEEFCGVINARGGEKYVNIGNFTPTKDVMYSKIDSAGNEFMSKYAYYLIDNVKVFPVENEFECGCANSETVVLKDYTIGNNIHTNNQKSNQNKKTDKNKKTYFNKLQEKNQNQKSDTSKMALENDTLSIENTNKNIIGMDNITEVSVGISVTLAHITFDHEKSELKPESSVELNKLVDLLRENPEMEIEIFGYSDNTGNDDFNIEISLKRAKAVADYLRDNKIKKKRISCKGLGNTLPVADNNNAEGRSKNRRVEFTIVKK